MGKMKSRAERPRRGLANFFVSAAAVALGAVAVVLAGDVGPAEAASDASSPSEAQAVLDFQFYKKNVEPIFLRGHGEGGLVPGACVMCHSWQVGTPFKLQPLQHDAGGDPYWTKARSRHNFEVVSRLVAPGFPQDSRLLLKPLATDAGGTEYHVGGKFWESQDDLEWQILAEWVGSAPGTQVATSLPAPDVDFDFFRSCVQRVFLNPREGAVTCTTCHAGGSRGFAPPVPEGRTFWNEEESRRNFEVLMRFVTPGHPMQSLFLQSPLHPDGGGTPMHGGGIRWESQDDPEWRVLAAWVRGENRGGTCPAPLQF